MVRGGAQGGRSAYDPHDGPPLLRPAAGRGPALVPAAPAEPLRRRGPADGPRLAVRWSLERCPRPHSVDGRAASDLQRDRAVTAARSCGGRPAPRAGVPAALRAPRRELHEALA